MKISKHLREVGLSAMLAAGTPGCERPQEPVAPEAAVRTPREATPESPEQQRTSVPRIILNGIDVTDRYHGETIDSVQILVNGEDRTARYTEQDPVSGPTIRLDGIPRETTESTQILIDGRDVTATFYESPHVNDPNRTYVDDMTGEVIEYTIEE